MVGWLKKCEKNIQTVGWIKTMRKKQMDGWMDRKKYMKKDAWLDG